MRRRLMGQMGYYRMQQSDERQPAGNGERGWGRRLFFGTLVGVLGFFYWLLIYSGGVAGHAG